MNQTGFTGLSNIRINMTLVKKQKNLVNLKSAPKIRGWGNAE
jgi:hypothetical protein